MRCVAKAFSIVICWFLCVPSLSKMTFPLGVVGVSWRKIQYSSCNHASECQSIVVSQFLSVLDQEDQ